MKKPRIRIIIYSFLACLFLASAILAFFDEAFWQPIIWCMVCAVCLFEEPKALKPMPMISYKNDIKRFFQNVGTLSQYKKVLKFFIGITLFGAVSSFVNCVFVMLHI